MQYYRWLSSKTLALATESSRFDTNAPEKDTLGSLMNIWISINYFNAKRFQENIQFFSLKGNKLEQGCSLLPFQIDVLSGSGKAFFKHKTTLMMSQ